MSKKTENNLDFKDLLSRQDYLIVQANDLAKAFGNLNAFEHKILDYCFSFVTRDSKVDQEYHLKIKDVLAHFNLSTSGTNYTRVAMAFKHLNENTALYIRREENGVTGILMTQLLKHVLVLENGNITFSFSDDIAPYVFDLKEKYYSFHLSEISRIKSKYSLILMKLWQSRDFGDSYAELSGSLEEWEEWFLGAGKRWPAGRFNQKVLQPAIKELEEKLAVSIDLQVQKRGRSIVGYAMAIRHNTR